jgi:hypothetical protein
MEAWATPRQNSMVTMAAGGDSGWARAVAPRMGYPSPTLSIPYCARTRTAAARILAQRGRRRWACRGGNLIPIGYCTIRVPIQSPDSHSLEPNFSKVSLVTHSTLCSKVSELQTSYNSTIGIGLIWALDQGLIQPQRWLCYTENLNFRVKPAWQSNFRLYYLQYFLNNNAHILKQSCSPMLGLQVWCGDLGQNLFCLKVTRSQRWPQYTEIQT